jgi:hypothetical protein
MLVVLIFFLFFIIELKLVNADVRCRGGYINGICTSWYYYDSRTEGEVPEAQPTEVPFQETQTMSQWVLSQFFTLVFQFFGIVVLFIILIVLIQSIIESK